MSQTESGDTGTSSYDTSETSVEHEDATASPVPPLAKICTALLLKTMHQMVFDTVAANLHEEAEVGIVNVSLMRLTCADLRKAFNTKCNLDQVLQGSSKYSSHLHLSRQAQFLLLYTVFQAAAVLPGKSDHAVQSVLHKTVLAHGTAYHAVSFLSERCSWCSKQYLELTACG